MTSVNPQILRSLFQKSFSPDEWTEILRQLFGATNLRKEPETLPNTTDTETGYYLGSIKTADSYEIGLFRYDLKKGSVLHKKVGLRNLVKTFTKHLFDAALAVFDDGKHWRLSFVCDLKTGEQTPPKRFTFVFGDADSKYHTAVDRLSKLQESGITFENLRAAFSVETLTREFYKELFGWYEKAKNKSADENLIRFITRIMFCWFIKQKGLIPNEVFSTSTNGAGGNYYQTVLRTLFFEVLNKPLNERKKTLNKVYAKIPFLNGGLFEELAEDKQFSLDNKLFSGKESLLDLLKRYNWTVEENTPTDIDVSLDPELLGKVFENLLGEVNPETHESARKASGSFYTPREIVDYMVSESLNAYQQNGNDLLQCKILDPACGSGAFPMGILNKMVELLSDQPQAAWANNRYELKRNIIENCLFGVDIQPIAIQITKLRFFMSLIADQNDYDAAQPDKNFNIIPLPNLETKFVAGNTLIGIKHKKASLFDSKELAKQQKALEAVRHFLFSATPQEKKNLRAEDKAIRKEMRLLLMAADDLDKATATLLAEWNPYDQTKSADFFDPQWMFGVEKFHIVIGNPPYIDSEMMTKIGLEWERKYIVEHYEYVAGNWDIYMAFFEKGLNLSNGILTYITPDKWLSKPFGKKFRELCMIPKLKKILHVGSKIFDSVTVDGVVSLFVEKVDSLTTFKYDTNKQIKKVANISKTGIQSPFLIDFLFSENFSLITKIDKLANSYKLADFAECENACATSDAYKLVPFIEDRRIDDDNEIDYRLINTGTIEKYGQRWGRKEIIYLGKKIMFPVVNRQKFQENFGNAYTRKASMPKIIFKGLNLLDACLDLKGDILPGKTTLVICGQDEALLKCLGAIINSKLAFFYIKNKYASSSYCGGITFTRDMINNLPIPRLSLSEQKRLTSLVDKILAAKTAAPQADTTDLEAQIDAMVFQLYNLTESEIMTVMLSIPSIRETERRRIQSLYKDYEKDYQ